MAFKSYTPAVRTTKSASLQSNTQPLCWLGRQAKQGHVAYLYFNEAALRLLGTTTIGVAWDAQARMFAFTPAAGAAAMNIAASSEGRTPRISAHGLSRAFPDLPALEGCSFVLYRDSDDGTCLARLASAADLANGVTLDAVDAVDDIDDTLPF